MAGEERDRIKVMKNNLEHIWKNTGMEKTGKSRNVREKEKELQGIRKRLGKRWKNEMGWIRDGNDNGGC